MVLLTTFIVGDKAETEARQSLEDQIERHLTDASIEAAATIGERFRRIQYAVLDVTAFALKDALQEVSVCQLPNVRCTTYLVCGLFLFALLVIIVVYRGYHRDV